MKKALLIILSLILCMTMLTGCFSSFEEIVDDVDPDILPNNDVNSDNSANTGVSMANKQIAIDSFNKIDLSAFAGTSFDYMSVIKELNLSAGFEMSGTVDGEEGAIALDAAVKDGVVYLSSLEGEKGSDPNVTEIFVKFSDEALDMYQKYTDGTDPEYSSEWAKNSVPMDQMMGGIDAQAITDAIAKIKIPALTEDLLTEKNGMLLLSNEYIVDLVLSNADLLEEATNGMVTKDDLNTKEEILEEMAEANLEIYLGTGADTITKVAVSFENDGTKLYAELALTADAKALDYVTVKINSDCSVGEVEYKPESVITVKTILGEENALVGINVDATIYAGSGSAENGIVQGGPDAPVVQQRTQHRVYNKMTVSATVNLANIGAENADIVTVDLKMAEDKIIKVVEEFNTDTRESKVISASAEDGDGEVFTSIVGALKSVNDKQITLTCDIGDDSFTMKIKGDLEYTVTDEKLDFEGSVSAGDKFDLDFSGFINAGDFTMPALPNIQ